MVENASVKTSRQMGQWELPSPSPEGEAGAVAVIILDVVGARSCRPSPAALSLCSCLSTTRPFF